MQRMYVVSRLVVPPRVVAPVCRFMATTTKKPPTTTPPQQLDLNKGPKPTPTQTTTSQAAPNKPAPSKTATQQQPSKTAGVPTSSKSTGKLSKAQYEDARLALPIRYYNKAGRLASRLYLLAENSGNKDDLEKVHKGLNTIGELMKKDKRAESYFINPTRTPDQKRKLLQALSKNLNFPPVLMQFFEELWKKDIKYLSKMITDLDSLVMARNKTVNVMVTLAEQNQPKPTEQQVRDALHYDKDTTVRLNFTIDPEIEGGAILRSKDRIANFSHAKIIKQYKEKLAKQDSQGSVAERLKILNDIKKMKDSVEI